MMIPYECVIPTTFNHGCQLENMFCLNECLETEMLPHPSCSKATLIHRRMREAFQTMLNHNSLLCLPAHLHGFPGGFIFFCDFLFFLGSL